MSEMVEKVARAICRSYLSSEHEGWQLNRLVEREWADWSDVAREAITAMREPTGCMYEAGLKERNEHANVTHTYQAMIDAELNAPATTPSSAE